MSRASATIRSICLALTGLVTTAALAQPASPLNLPPPLPGPLGQEGVPQNGRERRAPPRTRPFSFYTAPAIPEISMIDDPVIGFGNEALWSEPEEIPVIGGPDIAVSASPD